MSNLPPVLQPVQLAVWSSASANLVAMLNTGEPTLSVHRCTHVEEVRRRLVAGCEALIVDAQSNHSIELVAHSGDVAVLVVLERPDEEAVLDWLRRGAQEVLLPADLSGPMLRLRVRTAIERKRIEREARTAYATDLDTGLPHQQQLIEHMSQLLALREREPAPMAVLALRIEGLAATQARFGREASNALRRKLGVRLRAGVRASDVVASLSDDVFAVLLGSILTPADAARVGAKLQASLMNSFRVAAHDIFVSSAMGIGQYPQDGVDPLGLLRRAVGLAAATQAQGHAPGLGHVDAKLARGAANDE